MCSRKASSTWQAANSVFVTVLDRIIRVYLKSHKSFCPSFLLMIKPMSLEMKQIQTPFTILCNLLVPFEVPPQDILLLWRLDIDTSES